jgi:hypothetical protein
MPETYIMYIQRWKNGKLSYHRSASDIPEFAMNQEPIPEPKGGPVVDMRADSTAFDRVKDNLGVWF